MCWAKTDPCSAMPRNSAALDLLHWIFQAILCPTNSAGSSVPAGCTCNAGYSGKAPNSGCGGSCPTAFPSPPLLQRRLTVGAVAHAPRPFRAASFLRRRLTVGAVAQAPRPHAPGLRYAQERAIQLALGFSAALTLQAKPVSHPCYLYFWMW